MNDLDVSEQQDMESLPVGRQSASNIMFTSTSNIPCSAIVDSAKVENPLGLPVLCSTESVTLSHLAFTSTPLTLPVILRYSFRPSSASVMLSVLSNYEIAQLLI